MICARCIRNSLLPSTRYVTPLAIRSVFHSVQPQSVASKRYCPLFFVPSNLPFSNTNDNRPLSILARPPTRPSIPIQSTQSTALSSEIPSNASFFPLSQPSPQQIRGAKRNTYNPSHVVRKRRHGYLSRIKTRTGRMILKRRRMKGRSTLSH